MASKRTGKETGSSSGGPPSKRQAAPRNHDIEFNTPEQRSRYKSLLSKPLHPCRYSDSHSMEQSKLQLEKFIFFLLTTLDKIKLRRNFANKSTLLIFTKEYLNKLPQRLIHS